MPKKLTTEEFIEKAKQIHGDKYDYSLTEYISNKKKVKIICPIHGVFEQRPINHLQGCGCIKCSGLEKLTTEEFIEKAKKVHGNKYDYSLTEYITSKKKVKIICPVHGVFEQNAANHLKGTGCPNCTKEILKNKPKIINQKIIDRFILKSNIKHNNKYDYSSLNYTGVYNKAKIICPIHGMFEQTPHEHLRGRGCPKCANISHANKTRKNTEKYIQQAREVHGDKYDYSKMIYVNNYTDIEIICPDHGSFFQNPKTHLRGCGCPQCGGSISEKKYIYVT
jgi:hypothetical protein